MPPIAASSTEITDISYAAAKAIVGGRFVDVETAVAHREFEHANPDSIREACGTLRMHDLAVTLCKQEESIRKKQMLLEIVALNPEESRTNFDFQDRQFDDLLSKFGSIGALSMTEKQLDVFAWSFNKTAYFDKRYYAWHFQYAVYADLVDWAGPDRVMHGNELLAITERIFGTAAAYCIRSVSNAVKAGRPEQRHVGRAPSFPREVEAVLFRFVSCNRRHNLPVYKTSIISYAQRLIDGTEAALSFVKIDEDDKYVTDEEGHLMWDPTKWDHWFYRRFWGDRREDGASTGNQNILDFHRAKWHSFEAMEPYYHTHVQSLIDEGICRPNPLCGPTSPRTRIRSVDDD